MVAKANKIELLIWAIRSSEADMPIILWLLGVPLVVVVLLMLTHVI